MKKFNTLLVGGLLVLGVAAAALAQNGHHQRGNPLDRLQSTLNLTPEQVQQLKPTFEAMQQRHKAQREQFKAQMTALLTPEQRSKMESQKGEHGRGGFRDLNLTEEQKAAMKGFWESQKASREQERAQMDAQLQAALTPEQLTKFQEMKAQWGQHRRGDHHRKDNG